MFWPFGKLPSSASFIPLTSISPCLLQPGVWRWLRTPSRCPGIATFPAYCSVWLAPLSYGLLHVPLMTSLTVKWMLELVGSSTFLTHNVIQHPTGTIERTKNRPLASGRISVFAALTYVLIQYAIGIAWFYLTVEDLAWAVPLRMVYSNH